MAILTDDALRDAELRLFDLLPRTVREVLRGCKSRNPTFKVAKMLVDGAPIAEVIEAAEGLVHEAEQATTEEGPPQ